jgi:hypothetical protein
MGYPTVNNVPLDQIFDPYISGTKASLTGYTVMISEVAVDLRDLFAPIYLGTSAAPTKYKVNNADLNTIFAKKGTAQYALPIDGNSYVASGQRGTTSLTLNMLSNGTYNVTRFQANNGGTSVLASGTWLPSGDSASSYTCTFAFQLISSGAFGGSNSTTNDAVTQSPLTTSRAFQQASIAANTGQSADQQGKVTLKLYKSGVLRSTTVVTFSTEANGN